MIYSLIPSAIKCFVWVACQILFVHAKCAVLPLEEMEEMEKISSFVVDPCDPKRTNKSIKLSQ